MNSLTDKTDARPLLQATLFGPPQLLCAGAAIPLARRQMRALFFRLAVTHRPVARGQLCFLFWPDIGDSAARRNLTVLLNQLRQALPCPDVVQSQGDCVLLNPAHLQTDTVAFGEALAQATRSGTLEPLTTAIDLYRGPFLDGFVLPSCAEFEAWATQERQSWERRYLDALALLVDAYVARGVYPEAIAAAQRALAVDPLAEEMHRQLITLYATAGDRTAALRQFEQCVVLLERELEVSPLPETRAVYEAVRQGQIAVGRAKSARPPAPAIDHSSAGAADGAPQTQPGRPALPAPATPLIDREAEMADLHALFQTPGVRLLTLTGPGGSGKTRLALQVAWTMTTQVADGAAFVALAPVRDPELVLQAIAHAYGLKQSSPSTLADYLGDKESLLVLDNCEHLLAAGPAISSLLAAAPKLRILATSRAALNLHGEHTFPVPPLPLPDLTNLPPLATLATVPSVALLLARTQALNPRFQLTAENAADVAAICVRLDGLPLALELAAARLKLLAPRDLVRRLDKRLALLTHGSHDLPERQRTLRATIEWSYRLLNIEEQIWFERCSVFVGSWPLAALEGIDEQLRQHSRRDALHPALANDRSDRTNLLDVLTALTDKSLVQVQETDESELRFTLLETIREFAAEQLQERGAADVVAQAQADYYRTLIEPWDINAPAWLTDIARELDNLRAALRWYLSRGDQIEAAMHLGYRLGRFWYWRDQISEGRWWLEQLVTKSVGVQSASRADLLAAAALQASVQGDTARALALHTENLALCAALQLGKQRVGSLNALATLHARNGDHPRAIGYMEESLALARQLDNPDTLCNACYLLAGILVDAGQQIPRALVLYEECLTVARTHQRPIVESMTLASLGIAYALTGDLSRAATLLPQALQMQQAMNATMALGWTHQYLGLLALLQGNDRRAAHEFIESLAAAPQGGSQFIVPLSLEGVAGVWGLRRQPMRAALLLGAAEALRAAIDHPRPPIERAFYHAILTSIQAQLSEAALQPAWQQGRQLTAAQAIAEARLAIHECNQCAT